MDLVVATASDEELLIDLLNSTPVVDGVATDELRDTDVARAWCAGHGLPDLATKDIRVLRAVRDRLQAIVRGEDDPRSLERFVSSAALRPTVTDHGLEWRLVGAAGVPAAAVRAVVAWDGLRINSAGRLRPCANTECRLFLIDRSKPNTARWCSMASCGNRMKARRHYRRARGADSPA